MKKLILIISYLLITLVTNAQYTELHTFGVTTGADPKGSLISDGTYLYGTTYWGGISNVGTIFKVKPDGTGYITLYDFNDSEGSYPSSSLILDGSFLYGMTLYGGNYSKGVIFRIKPDGREYTVLFSFDGSITGYVPGSSLISDGTFLYGMASNGGVNSYGTIFKIKTDGTEFTKLLDFDHTITGNNPYGSLIFDGTFLYGMAVGGGVNNNGTIFKIKPDGTAFTKLLDFNDTLTGKDPYGSLIYDGTFLYGMTTNGGTIGGYGFGTVFKIKTDGTAYSKLLDFNDTVTGVSPRGSLIYDGSYLYGMTNYGGTNNAGTIFKLQPDGTEFTKVLDFNDSITGGYPLGSLLLDGSHLCGVTQGGGVNNNGTIFKIQPDGTLYSRLFDFADQKAEGRPHGALISDGSFFYGMAEVGGANGDGAIFKIKPDGTGYTKLLDFDDTITGRYPRGELVSDGTSLYGMTNGGGIHGFGTIFKIQPDGTAFTKLFDFDSINGIYPTGALYYDGTYLYGMAWYGGINHKGTIFKILPDGTGFSKLLDFNDTTGVNPFDGSLISDGTYLYGMTSGDGVAAKGTIFKIKPDGTAFTKLFDFDGATSGSYPYGPLYSDGSFLYGMTFSGGAHDYGTIIKIQTDGTGFTKLLDFDGTGTGSNPRGSLISDGTFLYGMTNYGGSTYEGVLFKIKPDGTDYTKLLNFDHALLGGDSFGTLISDGSFLYGTVGGAGPRSMGVIFKMTTTVPPCAANFTATYNSLSDNYTIATDSATTSLLTSYSWDFGDGTSSHSAVPTHAYAVAGSYNVCMKIYRAYGDSCSYCQSLTGGPGFTINLPDSTCVANYTTDYDSISNTFTLTVDSTTTALATSYLWEFGDGSTSTLATPIHTYAVDSLYTVCMKIYGASGDSCSYCHTIGVDSAGNIIRDGGFSLVVHNATTGVSENIANQIAVTIYPNPTTGILQLAVGNGQLKSSATLSIYNVVGEKIYSKEGKQLNSATTIDLSDQPNGIYFMQLKTSSETITQKIIINK